MSRMARIHAIRFVSWLFCAYVWVGQAYLHRVAALVVSHVKFVNELCRMREWVVWCVMMHSCKYMSESCLAAPCCESPGESCHGCEWVVLHVQKSRDSPMQTYEWVMSRVWMSHMLFVMTRSYKYMDESCLGAPCGGSWGEVCDVSELSGCTGGSWGDVYDARCSQTRATGSWGEPPALEVRYMTYMNTSRHVYEWVMARVMTHSCK